MGSVFIHGPRSSGKSTMARALMICVQGTDIECQVNLANVTAVFRGHGQSDIVFIGRYRNMDSSGMDNVSGAIEAAEARAERGEQIVMESRVPPNVPLCARLHKNIPDLRFFWIGEETPWARQLRSVGLPIETGDWSYVFNRCKDVLGVTEPETDELLT